jgi:rubrerythrin
MNIIECTIKMRKEMRAHYERIAAAVTDNELKRLFSLLASAEDEHIDKLLTLKDNLRDSACTVNTLKESVCVFSPHIDPKNLGEILRNDVDAYRHVVQEEEETIEFYDHLGAEASDKQLKKICQTLADNEREHLTMVENIYSFVEEPRTYLEWGEFSNLKSL